MGFADYDQIKQEPLALPIRGKTYVIPEVTADVGLKLAVLRDESFKAAAGEDVDETKLRDLDDDSEQDLYNQCLGTAYQEMVDDGVPYGALKLAGITAYIDFAMGREAAETVWATGGRDPKAETPKSSGQPPTETPTRSAAGSTTKQPASRTGTSSRKVKSPADRKPKASRGAGR